MKQMDYSEARPLMQPGDLIAFGGRGLLSGAIKWVTKSNVSHVGCILKSNVPALDGQHINQIIESTSLGDGFAGVQINRMSIHIKRYDGEIWWFPMCNAGRNLFNDKRFFEFMLAQDGKEYDFIQAIGSAIDYTEENREECRRMFGTDLLSENPEDFEKLFCSELYTAGMEKAGMFEGGINASETTPADVCKFWFHDAPVQIKGTLTELN